MKKYRLTKITVKTREIISVPATAANENENSVCPVCHAPINTSLAAAENVADAGRMSGQKDFSEERLTKEK